MFARVAISASIAERRDRSRQLVENTGARPSAAHLARARACSPACAPRRCSASTPAPSTSKSTSSFGLPSFTMVGLPDASVRESRDRVHSAIRNSGFEFPPHRITVNLAPADVRKAGASFDLPIALGILAASGRRRTPAGRRPRAARRAVARRIDPRARAACCRSPRPRGATDSPASCCRRRTPAKRRSCRASTCSRVSSLAEAVRALNEPGDASLPRQSPLPAAGTAPHRRRAPDLADVRGQLLARRALEIAAAGGHNLLLVGPPGAGKTMMARRVAGILPPLTFDEALDVDRGAFGRRPAAARRRPARRSAVPRAAPHDFERGAGRRRIAAAAGRSQPRPSRRAVSRRDARVQPPRARGAAAAARGRARDDRARRAHGGLPRALHAGRRDEPVSVRIPGDTAARVPLHAAADGALSRSAVRPAARSAGPHRRRAGAAARRARRRRRRRIVGRGPRARRRRARAPGARVTPATASHQRRADAAADGRSTARRSRPRCACCVPAMRAWR